MSDSLKELKRAHALIKRDKIEEALDVLRPIVYDEPENIDAWWLLAYSATDPREVREALIKVLRLDPNYANAPKARDMLGKLNERYPPDADELVRFPELQTSFPDVFADDDLFGGAFDLDSSFGEPAPAAVSPPFSEDIFGAVEPPGDVDDLFTGADIFAELEEAPFVIGEMDEGRDARTLTRETAPEPVVDFRLAMQELETEPLDAETLASREERAGRRRGRGRRIFRVFIGLALAVLVAIALLILNPFREKSEVVDPGALEVIDVESDVVSGARSSAEAELNTAQLGSSGQVLLADSELGNALFVEICGSPEPGFPQLVARGMDIAARQAPLLEGELEAVGVSVELCEEERQDNLYRAVVSVTDATRYLGGEISWEAFQALWKTAR